MFILINQDKISILELTCCFETNVEAAHSRKTNKYTFMKNDLEELGYKVDLVPFEIGSRGHITKKNVNNLTNIFTKHKIKTNVKSMSKTLGKISLLCTFAIFTAYQQPSWVSPPLLQIN